MNKLIRFTRLTIEKMCGVFKISQSSYYYWLKNGTSERWKENESMLIDIMDIFENSKSSYGSPRMTEELKANGWLYLTVIIDLFDRKAIGWSMSKGLTKLETIVAAWLMAITNRPITNELIFHSDRGVQYASEEFAEILKENKLITRSMSRKGNCWDNSVAESFFKSIKVVQQKKKTFSIGVFDY